jgi:hypothetical protein
MDGPSTGYREQIFAKLEAVSTEDELDGLLEELSTDLERDLSEVDSGNADDVLASVEAWTALISHAVAYYYAPRSPWPNPFAGWDKKVVARLRGTAGKLHGPLQNVRSAVGAQSYSISIAFPLGVSVGLSW